MLHGRQRFAFLVFRQQRAAEILRVDPCQAGHLDRLSLRFIAECQGQKTNLPRAADHSQRFEIQRHRQGARSALGCHGEIECRRLRGFDRHPQLACSWIKAPCRDRTFRHLAHRESLRHFHDQCRHLTLGGSHRHQMPAIHHSRPRQIEVGNFVEEAGLFGPDVALFGARLEGYAVGCGEHHCGTALVGGETRHWFDPSCVWREKLPSRLIPPDGHLPHRCHSTRQFPAFHRIGQGHFIDRLAGQLASGIRDQVVGGRAVERCLDHPQSVAGEAAQNCRGF